MRGLPLLSQFLPISFQHPLDCILGRTDLRLLPFVLLAIWRISDPEGPVKASEIAPR
jgi:hypothetical protein